MVRPALVLVITCAVWSAGGPAWAQQWIGTYNDWNVFQRSETRTCYMSSTPIDMEPKALRRGDVFVRVTQTPSGGATVSVVPGLGLDTAAGAVMTVDATEFRLRPNGAELVATDAAQEAALVRAMMAGSQMAVRVTSGRGPVTTDRYSLTGFTAANNSMIASCRKAA
jgi:hypothetical protein